MRINEELGFIYLANPKTGSTSIRKKLDEKSDSILLKKMQENNNFHQHWSAKIYEKILLEKYNIIFSKLFSFTTIRNPWGRIVSAFNFSKCDENGNPFWSINHDSLTEGKYNFSNFLIDLDKNDYWCKIGIPHLKNFAFDENSKQIVTKIYKIEDVTSEQINNDFFKHTGKKLNIEKIPKLNQTKKVNYRDYYTEKWMVEKVRDCFESDIKYGNYIF